MAGLTVAFSLDMGGWAAAGVLAVALGGGCLWFRHEARQARKDAVLWESSARGALASLEELSAARIAAENALAEHRERVRGLESESAALRAKIREAKRYYETVRLWYDDPLPVPLRGLLADGGDPRAASGQGDASGASADAHAGTRVPGDDQRRPAGMGAGKPGGAAHVQCGQAGR